MSWNRILFNYSMSDVWCFNLTNFLTLRLSQALKLRRWVIYMDSKWYRFWKCIVLRSWQFLTITNFIDSYIVHTFSASPAFQPEEYCGFPGFPTRQAGVMDMVSTTGVEVMTEVVTEAAVGEVPVVVLQPLKWDAVRNSQTLQICSPPRAFRKTLKQNKNTEQIDSTPKKGTWNPGMLCCELSNLLGFFGTFWQRFSQDGTLRGWGSGAEFCFFLANFCFSFLFLTDSSFLTLQKTQLLRDFVEIAMEMDLLHWEVD